MRSLTRIGDLGRCAEDRYPEATEDGAAESRSTPGVWCAVANIVKTRSFGPGGAEAREGTKHFSPGAKVYVRNVFWGMGGESMEVVGRHRGSPRLVVMVVKTDWLTNPRVKVVYDPRIIAKLCAEPGDNGTSDHGDGFVQWDDSDKSYMRAAEVVRRIDPSGNAGPR